MQVDQRCANPHCNCTVEEANGYCDSHCREQAKSSSPAGSHCECQHADCGQSTPGMLGTPDQGSVEG